MELTKFSAPYTSERSEDITLVTLSNDEWLVFLRNLANCETKEVGSGSSIKMPEIEWIDTCRCVPLCANNNFIRRYGADTRMVSVVCKDYGEVHLRLWFAERGVLISLNKVMEELFPGGLPSEIISNFWNWWSKLPLEAQSVGGRIVSRQQKEFGVGHLSAWIQQIIDQKPPQVAWQNFLYHLRPMMYAYELFLIWASEGLVNNNGGRLTPKNVKL